MWRLLVVASFLIWRGFGKAATFVVNTSEFSACVTVTGGTTDPIFTNGFE
jgi:hypothetical protein